MDVVFRRKCCHLAYEFPLDVQGSERTTASVRRLTSVSGRNSESSPFPPSWPHITVENLTHACLVTNRGQPMLLWQSWVAGVLPNRRDDRFKTYSGSGAALVQASGAEVSSQLRGGKPTDSVLHPFKPETERRDRRVRQTRAATKATHREAPMDKCWALFRRRAEASSEATTRDLPTFLYLSASQPASQLVRMGDGLYYNSSSSRSRMNSLMAIWRKYRRGSCNCHSVFLICEFEAERKTGGITTVKKGGRTEWVYILRTGLSRPRLCTIALCLFSFLTWSLLELFGTVRWCCSTGSVSCSTT